MGDEDLRALTRAAQLGDPDAASRLRAAKKRLRGRRYRERPDIPFMRWCPDCGTWNVMKPKQKDRMPWLALNRGRDRKPMPSRYCRRCEKKPSGPCLPPSPVIEARIKEVQVHLGWGAYQRERELLWLGHALRRARKREGIPEPTKPHRCLSSDLDYFNGQKRAVRCKVCGTIYDAVDGAILSPP